MEVLLTDQEAVLVPTNPHIQQPEGLQTEQPVEQPAVQVEQPVEQPAEPSPGPSIEHATELQWYETELEHHTDYLNRWSAGAVTEGSDVPALFEFPQVANPNRITEEFPVEWTNTEKLKFFGSIARRSRWQPDLIAQDIGTKSQIDVLEYIQALEEEQQSLKAFSKPRKSNLRSSGWINGLAPAAREMSEGWVAWEEEMSEQLTAKESQPRAEMPLAVDSQYQIQRLTNIAKGCRAEGREMDKASDRDLNALRPNRLKLLQNAKREMDETMDKFKLECATQVIRKVLRACDENGLRVLDVVVKQVREVHQRNINGAINAKTRDPASIPGDSQPAPPATISAFTDADTACTPVPCGKQSHVDLDLQSHKAAHQSHPADDFEKQAAKLAKEEREKARLKYLAQVPIRKLSNEQKQEKTMLGARIRMRERKRRMAGVEREGSKRKRNKDTDEEKTSLSKRLRRDREEQERLDYLTRLKMGKTVDVTATEDEPRKLTEDEKREFKTLQARIHGRNRYRSRVAENLRIAVKQEVELSSTSTSRHGFHNDMKTTSHSPATQESEDPAGLSTGNDTHAGRETKRKIGRPRKIRPQEKEEVFSDENKGERDGKRQTFKISADRNAEESRRANQFDDNGVGVTYFRLDLKRHYDAKVNEVTSFIDCFNDEFEMELRTLLKTGVSAIGRILMGSRYTPLLFAFAIRCRMELLDNQQLINLLKRTQSEGSASFIDLTQILDSFEIIVDNIRRWMELCVELTDNARRPATAPRDVTADIAHRVLSMVANAATMEEAEADLGRAPTKMNGIRQESRVLDVDWVDLVDPSDEFQEDALAEQDEAFVAADDNLAQVDQQQDAMDALEDEEYEERLERASRRPNDVRMGNDAIPVLEHDVFDWQMYECEEHSRWVERQKKIRDGMLPESWPIDVSAAAVSVGDKPAPTRMKRDLEGPRSVLRAAIYEYDRQRWRRNKRLQDPMYRLGGVHRAAGIHETAAVVESSDGYDFEKDSEASDDNEEEEVSETEIDDGDDD
ncbi:hypothetical protein QFC22_006688 [Naganishia vaughanmartiniae]|uniref:Uncharacterized protein n=1 Tax=Naganishia vaughanmartiniae TaxID=1424756 RepID=A0ACC2WFZ9_9TREE|nr:hypothetical protein QFC22_006688 [Naganishia vaughanmartiniae]